ncbi:hypothetical protein N7462_011675 [Penicillium macrosclerotiorum]|uniref:uncharacterized protein n=1 Tax=Penicillium macrosclerotiorum TaxID=303699 RepID=UPI0025492EB0|nr:uncharacterized protein N7462_011675 [Penicillium macrosclerotiorum]KAJ5662749.1 hypothetical protein N7462_011675 [Penicillium macrosclerotiorum]
MEGLYDHYKKLVDRHTRSKRLHDQHFAKHKKDQDPETNIHRAKLAISWAKDAYEAGKARLEFMQKFETAYGDVISIGTHIEAAQHALNSAKNGVKEIRTNNDSE